MPTTPGTENIYPKAYCGFPAHPSKGIISQIRPWPSPPITYLLITIPSHTIQSEPLTVPSNKQLQIYPGEHILGGEKLQFCLQNCAIIQVGSYRAIK